MTTSATLQPRPRPQIRRDSRLVTPGFLFITIAASATLIGASSMTQNFLNVRGPLFACAPMVQQSELAFRLLCRRYGVNVAWTPMYYAKNFADSGKHGASYRRTNYDGGSAAEVGPLVVQFAGDDPDTVLAAAQYVEGDENVAAIDLNFGCPQKIARKGHYGAFLLEEPDLCMRIVNRLATSCQKPVTAKMRVLPGKEETLELALGLARSGAAALTVHGRTRQQNKQFCGASDWSRIRDIVECLEQHGMGHVPVIANGGVETFADSQAILGATGAAGVMSAEALLEDPALFAAAVNGSVSVFGSGFDHLPPLQVAERQLFLAREYLALAKEYPPSHTHPSAVIKAHLFKLLHRCLASPGNEMFRNGMGDAKEFDDMAAVVDDVSDRYEQLSQAGRANDHSIVAGSWYRRHWTRGADDKKREEMHRASRASTDKSVEDVQEILIAK